MKWKECFPKFKLNLNLSTKQGNSQLTLNLIHQGNLRMIGGFKLDMEAIILKKGIQGEGASWKTVKSYIKWSVIIN